MANILIIDDSAYMRGKLKALLGKKQHTVTEADNGVSGLQLALSKPFDAALLDIIMPGMDGLKILDTLKERGSTLPVIVVTADIQDAIRRQCEQLGAAAFINKPPKEDEIMSAIDAVIGK